MTERLPENESPPHPGPGFALSPRVLVLLAALLAAICVAVIVTDSLSPRHARPADQGARP